MKARCGTLKSVRLYVTARCRESWSFGVVVYPSLAFLGPRATRYHIRCVEGGARCRAPARRAKWKCPKSSTILAMVCKTSYSCMGKEGQSNVRFDLLWHIAYRFQSSAPFTARDHSQSWSARDRWRSSWPRWRRRRAARRRRRRHCQHGHHRHRSTRARSDCRRPG